MHLNDKEIYSCCFGMINWNLSVCVFFLLFSLAQQEIIIAVEQLLLLLWKAHLSMSSHYAVVFLMLHNTAKEAVQKPLYKPLFPKKMSFNSMH